MLLDYVLLIAAVVALVPYTLGPVFVRFGQRWPARLPFEPYDPIRHPLPDDLAEAFRASVDTIAGDGMREIADLAHASAISQIQLRVALLEDAAAGEHALVVGVRSTNPKAKIAACYVDFPTKFADGTTLSVLNTLDPEVFPPVPERVVVPFPQVRDPVRLRRASRALLERRHGGRPRVPLDPAGDPAGFVAAATEREYALQVRTGYLAAHESGGATVYRPTWRGALAMCWKLLPPMKQILQDRRRRQAEVMLADLGLAGRDERPIRPPASTDPLKWNLAVLALVALVYVVTRGPAGASPPDATRRAPFSLSMDVAVPADFAGAVRALEGLAGATAQPLVGVDDGGDPRPTPGVTVDADAARAQAVLAAARDRFLARGFYLFLAERNFGLGDARDRLGLFPRGDPYEIMILVGTNGWNYGIGPDSVVAWLRALERDHPFVITGIGFDWVSGRFTGEIKAPDALARRFHAFCPDIVDQGTGSVRALARELRDSRTLYCWWD